MKRTGRQNLNPASKKLKQTPRKVDLGSMPKDLLGLILRSGDEEVNKEWNSVIESSWEKIMHSLGWEVYWPISMRNEWRPKFVRIMNIKRRVKFLKDVHEVLLSHGEATDTEVAPECLDELKHAHTVTPIIPPDALFMVRDRPHLMITLPFPDDDEDEDEENEDEDGEDEEDCGDNDTK